MSENESYKIRIDEIIEIIKLSTKAILKKKKVPEAFFQQLSTTRIKREKIFKIKAQALSMEKPIITDGSIPCSKDPKLYSEPILPKIPSTFKSDHQKYPIKGTEKKVECKECKTIGRFDCETCNTTGQIGCKKCKGAGDYVCSKCGGQGTNLCRSCRGKGSKRCLRCFGRGYVTPVSFSSDGPEHVTCSRCGGKGRIVCKKCGGSARVRCTSCFPPGSGMQRCNSCSGSGILSCIKCSGKGYNICRKCDGSGFIWEFKVKNFQFNLIEQNYVVIDQNMKILAPLFSELPDSVWSRVSVEDLRRIGIEGKSNTSKEALDKINQFNNSLNNKDIKKRENIIYMTSGVFTVGKYNDVTYKLAVIGQGQKFLGKIIGLPRGLKLQKDGTQGSSDEQFSSIRFQKQLEKSRKKNIKKKKKLSKNELPELQMIKKRQEILEIDACPYCGYNISNDMVQKYLSGESIKCEYCNVEISEMDKY